MSNILIQETHPHPNSILNKVVFIGGPMGVGKTTLVSKLSEFTDGTYIERPTDNPFLTEHLRGEPLEAFKSQEWFLNRINQFLHSATIPNVIIDQHPIAVGFAYPRLFLEEGILTEQEFKVLAEAAIRSYRMLVEVGIPFYTISLTANIETLHERLNLRAASTDLDLHFLKRLNSHFTELPIPEPYMYLATDDLSVEDCAHRIRQALSSWNPASSR